MDPSLLGQTVMLLSWYRTIRIRRRKIVGFVLVSEVIGMSQRRRGARGIWGLLVGMSVVGIVLGGLLGYGVYRFAPAIRGFGMLANTTRTPTPDPTATSDPRSIPASASATTSLQQFNASLTSYAAQPIDQLSTMRLIIPSIQVNAPIVERGLVQGWMVVAPGNQVTHFVYSAYPGAPGNAVLYSHDGTVFRHLDKLAVGDTMLVQTPNGTSQFRVREMRIVSPDTVSVLDATTTSVLTLLTCYPYGVDTSRLVIIADRVSS